MRVFLKFTLACIVAAATSLQIAAQIPVPPDPRLGSLQADLENAKKLAVDERYNDAIAKAEDAIRKLKELRDTPPGQPDLVILAINGDGNRVVVTVQNKGNADLIRTERVGPSQTLRKSYTGFNVSIINANTGKPFDPNRPLRGSFTGSLPPGRTAQVNIGPITGCGGMNQPIFAVVDTRAEESDTRNNQSEKFMVRGGPCGS